MFLYIHCQLYSVPQHLAMRLVIAFADADDIKVKLVSLNFTKLLFTLPLATELTLASLAANTVF